jgi:hypothetical protein
MVTSISGNKSKAPLLKMGYSSVQPVLIANSPPIQSNPQLNIKWDAEKAGLLSSHTVLSSDIFVNEIKKIELF